MSAGSPRLSGLCASSLLALSSLSSGAEEGKANEPPEALPQAVLWYRSTEGCPDGASFLAGVGERASQVRLAEAGDRVDFVVNLAQTPEGARGRLERETERGTVAIREVEDPSCERVAKVVALNLSLALDPAAGHSLSTEEPIAQGATVVASASSPAEEPAASDAVSTPMTEEESADAQTEQRAADPGDPGDAETGSDESSATGPNVRFRLGAQGGIQSGVATGIMGRATVFGEARGLISSLPDLTFRAAAFLSQGASNTTLGTIDQTMWGGRLEVCPFSLGSETLFVSPCAAGELGQLRVAGPLSDSDLWWALGAHARGVWELAEPFSLEADVGASFPLSQYEIRAGSTVLYRSDSVGVLASLGAAIAF